VFASDRLLSSCWAVECDTPHPVSGHHSVDDLVQFHMAEFQYICRSDAKDDGSRSRKRPCRSGS